MRDRFIRNVTALQHTDFFAGSASSCQIFTQIVQAINFQTDLHLEDV